MTGLPAHCSHCGKVFISSAIQITDSTEISFSNVQVSCPRCHKMAKGIDGTFDFVNNAISVKRAPPKTIEIIELLQLTLREAKTGADVEGLVARLDDVSPELAKQAQKAVQRGGVPALILLLFWLLYSCTANPSTKFDWNLLLDQAHVYITGDKEYRFPEHTTGQASKPEQSQAQNRQQRRQQEHQSRKQQQKPGPRPSKTPR